MGRVLYSLPTLSLGADSPGHCDTLLLLPQLGAPHLVGPTGGGVGGGADLCLEDLVLVMPSFLAFHIVISLTSTVQLWLGW